MNFLSWQKKKQHACLVHLAHRLLDKCNQQVEQIWLKCWGMIGNYLFKPILGMKFIGMHLDSSWLFVAMLGHHSMTRDLWDPSFDVALPPTNRQRHMKYMQPNVQLELLGTIALYWGHKPPILTKQDSINSQTNLRLQSLTIPQCRYTNPTLIP